MRDCRPHLIVTEAKITVGEVRDEAGLTEAWRSIFKRHQEDCFEHIDRLLKRV